MNTRKLYKALLKGIFDVSFLAFFFSCESPNPPPVPAPVPNGTLKQSEDSLKNEEEEEEEKVSETPDLKPVTPSVGGADIGEEGIKTSVKICNAEGFYYDRYQGEKGTCSKVALAQVKCTEKGLLKLLTEGQKEQFKKSIKSTYKGWLLDQCIDCPKNTPNELCANKDNENQVGTKVFFVSFDESTNEIRGKAMFLPVRPKTEKEADSKSGKSDGDKLSEE